MKTWITPALVSALVVGGIAGLRAIAAVGGGAAKDLGNGIKLRAASIGRRDNGSSSVRARGRSEPWRLGTDGSVQRTRVRGMQRQTETGVWWLNKKGKVCVRWPNQPKKHCGFLASTDSGGFELTRHTPEKYPSAPSKVQS